MSSLSKLVIAIAVFCAVTLSAYTYAFAQEAAPPPQMPTPTTAEDNGARKLIEGLGILLRSIPQYELPEVLENGDILIRRIPKPQQTDMQK